MRLNPQVQPLAIQNQHLERGLSGVECAKSDGRKLSSDSYIRDTKIKKKRKTLLSAAVMEPFFSNEKFSDKGAVRLDGT